MHMHALPFDYLHPTPRAPTVIEAPGEVVTTFQLALRLKFAIELVTNDSLP